MPQEWSGQCRGNKKVADQGPFFVEGITKQQALMEDLLLPDSPKPFRAELRIDHGVRNAAVPQEGLK